MCVYECVWRERGENDKASKSGAKYKYMLCLVRVFTFILLFLQSN